MYYTRLLKHPDAECSILEELPIEGNPYLEQIVPDYFGRSNGDGYPHVLIICSDSNDRAWTDEEFRAKFLSIGNQPPDLLLGEWKHDKRAKRLSVHIDKSRSNIPDAVKEVLQAVKKCYEDAEIAKIGDWLEGLHNLFKDPNETISSHCHTILVRAIDRAEKEIGCKRTLFVRIVLPKNCFDEFKGRYYPPFLEYVVLGQLQDPKIQELETKVADLNKQIEERDNQIVYLVREKDKLKSEIDKKRVVPESEVNSIISTYDETIEKLLQENKFFRAKLAEVTELLTREDSYKKTRRIE